MFVKKLMLLFVFALAAISCQPLSQSGNGISSSIWNGVVTTKFKSVVALTDGDGAFCSGVAITPMIILTAAHCLHDKNHQRKEKDELLVYLGAGDKEDRYQGQYKVSFYDIHPDYVDELDSNETFFDFAYLVLDRPLELKKSEYAIPLTINQNLLKKTFLTSTRKKVVLVGYGQDEQGFTGLKRMTETNMVEVRDYDFVNDSREENDFWGEKSIDTGSCSGDSGGPAFIRSYGKNYLAGIAHAAQTDEKISLDGIGECSYNYFHVTCFSINVYGRIDIMMDWFLGTDYGQEYQAGL